MPITTIKNWLTTSKNQSHNQAQTLNYSLIKLKVFSKKGWVRNFCKFNSWSSKLHFSSKKQRRKELWIWGCRNSKLINGSWVKLLSLLSSNPLIQSYRIRHHELWMKRPVISKEKEIWRKDVRKFKANSKAPKVLTWMIRRRSLRISLRMTMLLANYSILSVISTYSLDSTRDKIRARQAEVKPMDLDRQLSEGLYKPVLIKQLAHPTFQWASVMCRATELKNQELKIQEETSQPKTTTRLEAIKNLEVQTLSSVQIEIIRVPTR